jgi:hypothetical protein
MVYELFLLLGQPVRRIQASCCLLALVALITAVPALHASKPPQAKKLTAGDIDDIIQRLHTAVQGYVFPETAAKLARELEANQETYRTLTDPSSLAQKLTADLRAVGLDQHLAVTFGEELGVRKNPTASEKQHAHDFDRANAYGLRSARRLPGNIGYIDFAYFSPDPDAGAAVAAAMQVVNGTDALIIDLRRNGGGSGDTERTLASYFLTDVIELSSIVENVDGKPRQRQHWTVAYLQGPRYVEKPVYILTSRHTHSAAEALSYDLQNLHVATIIGEPTSGDATSSTGEVDLGHGFSAFIPNGQLVSPVTHSNYFRVGVQPDTPVPPEKALRMAYDLALKTAKMSVASEELAKEKSEATKNPEAALLEETNGFPQQE